MLITADTKQYRDYSVFIVGHINTYGGTKLKDTVSACDETRKQSSAQLPQSVALALDEKKGKCLTQFVQIVLCQRVILQEMPCTLA